ncbi:uncharacterized protein METZ01_LOCUS404044, partial [marine metagenome]
MYSKYSQIIFNCPVPSYFTMIENNLYLK